MATRASIISEIALAFPDNAKGLVTPAVMRAFLTDLINTVFVPDSDGMAPIWVAAPATLTSPGKSGQIAQDGSYFYICIATNSWVKTAVTS